ncbi:S9 family peptidase [Chryseobacterium suipulveris]|uniref:S9 family peptidase n=1 Tax=Chryseobacterium suipulveris TaxID=2929800 RepID=A0ABY4BR49_9FLAO|nr:S9 family peptidase [Chryseobacterium suipulveris]UOE41678.1 S9 family peptidase [Chryseobacterium suipulveris]
MRRVFLFMAMALFSAGAVAQTKSTKAASGEVPIIDRSIFFGNPEISGGQLSPDGKFISFMKEYNGIMNIWVKKFDEPFDKARRLTNLERPTGGYFWTEDGKYILYVKDKGGNENYNAYAVSPTAAADAKTGIPESRNLTPFDDARVQIYMVSKKDPNVMMIGLNNRDAKWHDLYKVEINSGKLTKLNENTDRISGWIFDWDEKPRLALRNPEDGSTEFLSVGNDGKFTKIYSVSPLESAYPLAFTKDNSRVYVETNKGAETDLTKLVLMDPKTGAATDFEQDPLKKVDLSSASFSNLTKELNYTSYFDEKPRIYFKNKKMEADYNFLKSKFPGAEIAIASQTKDERKWLFTAHGDTKVSTVYFFDRDSKKITEQYTPRPKLKPYEQYLSPMTPITYKSSDGLVIPAYLTLPKNVEAKNLPLLVFPHGGPWARSYWGFNSYAQLFANRGFAVLDPNFRGSTGYGKKFLDAGNLQWGKLMQDDITWGVKDLVAKGIVDPKRVAIMGGSYGGYATLAGLTFTPDLYAAGVDIVGPSNLFTLLATIPPYWEAGRKIFTLRMGDESTEEGKKLLTQASPLFHAKNIKAPLMIIQGANDPRVKQPESDQIVIALRDLKRDVQYILAEDEGHGFAKPVNNMAMIAAAEKFLAKYIGTRYQAEMPDDVAKRLKEMTVDINTVKLAEKVDVKVPASLPALSGDFSAGTYNYDANIAVMGQNIKMDVTRTVKKDGNNWVVLDEATSPMGKMSDEVTFGKNFEPVKRNVVQGPVTMAMTKNGNEVKISAMGKEIPVQLAGAYLSEGAGADMILARLPLKEGYTTSFYTVDLMTMKPKTWILKVEGKEKIKGIDTWKVVETNAENPAEKMTLWIDPARKIAVKTEAVLPAMNNAVMTSELK